MRNHPEGVFISALEKTQLDVLYQQLTAFLEKDLKEKHFLIPYEKYRLVNHLFSGGNILEKFFRPDGVAIKALVDKKTNSIINKYLHARKA